MLCEHIRSYTKGDFWDVLSHWTMLLPAFSVFACSAQSLVIMRACVYTQVGWGFLPLNYLLDLCVLIYAGGYHHYDFFVYPSEVKLPKSLFDQMRDSRLINALLGRRNPMASAKEVDVKILSTEEMAKQCLNFYLEPYVEQLLAGKYSENFKVDVFVKEVASLFFQHQKLHIKHHNLIHRHVKDILKVKILELLILSQACVHPPTDSPFLSALYVYSSV